MSNNPERSRKNRWSDASNELAIKQNMINQLINLGSTSPIVILK